MKEFRLIDANKNRVAEGIRALEDLARFVLEDKDLTSRLRTLRHGVRKSFANEELIEARDVINDIGYDISLNSQLDKKDTREQMIEANCKRVQEGLRSIEESLKVLGYYNESKLYEALRYEAYNLEKMFYRPKYPTDVKIYAITGEKFSAGRDNITVVKELIKAGVKIIQYREKDKEKLGKYKECLEIRKLTKENGVFFIVNDDLDIALSVKADGVHIGQEDMPLEEVRKIVGDMVVGCSTHNPKQAQEAKEKGADYIGVGPIFNTTTKENVEHSEGLTYLKWVSENINIPHVAIGGINEKNIADVISNGGMCCAMISEIVGADDITYKIKQLEKIL